MEDSNMWFCPASARLEYHDIIYEMMDKDHINRRLTPLAVRENDGGYLDIINGRQDATRESITGDDSLTEYCV